MSCDPVALWLSLFGPSSLDRPFSFNKESRGCFRGTITLSIRFLPHKIIPLLRGGGPQLAQHHPLLLRARRARLDPECVLCVHEPLLSLVGKVLLSLCRSQAPHILLPSSLIVEQLYT